NGAAVSGQNTSTSTTGYPVGVQGSVTGTVGAGVNGNASQAGAVGVNGFNSATTGNATGVYGGTNSPGGSGVVGTNNSTAGGVGVSGNAAGPHGVGVNGSNSYVGTAGDGSYPVGVQGNVNGPTGAGVSGNASMAGASGVNGYNSATSGFAPGVTGTSASANGPGVNGFNNYSAGATGSYPVGVQGGINGPTGAAVQANANGAGAFGLSAFNNATSGHAVGAQGVTASPSGAALLGQTMTCGTGGCKLNDGTALELHSANDSGGWLIQGFSGAPNSDGFGGNSVFDVDGLGDGFFAGWLQATSSTASTAAVSGKNTDNSGTCCATGVSGTATGPSGVGVVGSATSSTGTGTGVLGITATPTGSGVAALAVLSGAVGVHGVNVATSGVGIGTQGVTYSPQGIGVLGESVHCSSPTGSCTFEPGTAGEFVAASDTGSYLLQGYSAPSGTAETPGSSGTQVFYVDGQGNGYFAGKLTVVGNISKGGGSFRIDHPLDPENKYLYHSFVESPDMKNIYDGIVVLDEKGEATVTLPDWFEALNQDFRYQLTCIGGYAPVYVASEVSGNKFRVAGGRPGLKVSWQVTGIRHDAYANAHRIPVEEEKPAGERGKTVEQNSMLSKTAGAAQ
ncbi:MAG TPA: hypothetical protein VKV17_13800, partial [Bryobacteraceae bacterium]|nr:hypothetical protein [Bryobacteraceae bacterium]